MSFQYNAVVPPRQKEYARCFMGRRIVMAAIPLFMLFSATGISDEDFQKIQYQKIDSTLRSKKISVDFEEATLKEAIGFVHTVTGLNIVIDQAVYKETSEDSLRITFKADDLPAGDILDLMLRFKGLGRCYRHGVLLITTNAESVGKPYLKYYDVRDLTFKIQDFPGPDIELKGSGEGVGPVFPGNEDPDKETVNLEEITELIRTTCGESSWDENAGCKMSQVNGVLLVKQTAGVHYEIAKLLAMLRGLR